MAKTSIRSLSAFMNAMISSMSLAYAMGLRLVAAGAKLTRVAD